MSWRISGGSSPRCYRARSPTQPGERITSPKIAGEGGERARGQRPSPLPRGWRRALDASSPSTSASESSQGGAHQVSPPCPCSAPYLLVKRISRRLPHRLRLLMRFGFIAGVVAFSAEGVPLKQIDGAVVNASVMRAVNASRKLMLAGEAGVEALLFQGSGTEQKSRCWGGVPGCREVEGGSDLCSSRETFQGRLPMPGRRLGMSVCGRTRIGKGRVTEGGGERLLCILDPLHARAVDETQREGSTGSQHRFP